MNKKVVVDYDPEWPAWFESLKKRLESVLDDIPHEIEHVGSTSVPGMTAKPIIDIDVVIDMERFDDLKQAFGTLGYQHVGDQDIPGREVFKLADDEVKDSLPSHHLYACDRNSVELRKHIIFRDFLREHAEWREKLSEHKHELCRKFDNDLYKYIDAKSDMVEEITRLADEYYGSAYKQ